MSSFKYYNDEITIFYGNEVYIDPPIFTNQINISGYFYFENTIDNITINKETGSITIYPNIDINIYLINIFFENLKTELKLIVKPIIIYEINSFSYESDNFFKKYNPIIKPENIQLNFKLENDISGIQINNNGEISFNENLMINTYKLIIVSNYEDIISHSIITFDVFPVINYKDKIIYLNHLEKYETDQPIVNPVGGIFSIANIVNGITIDPDNGIIKIGETKSGLQNIIINYYINSVYVTTTLIFYIKTNIEYKKLVLDYGILFETEKPHISDFGGYFETDNKNITIDYNLGIIKLLNNIPTGDYKINIFYTINNYKTSIIFELKIMPIFYYKNNNLKIIYGYKDTSEEPILTELKDGIFTILNEIDNVYINPKTGIIYFNLIIDVGKYQLDINYNKNNINKIIYFHFCILPKIEINDNTQEINIVENLKDINILVTPENGIFTNNLNIPIINNQLKLSLLTKEVKRYDIEITYEYKKIKNNIKYSFTINPKYYYENNSIKLNYNEIFTSEYPIIYPSGGIFDSNLYENIILDQSTGVISINKTIKVGKYELTFFYTVNDIKTSTNFFIEIYPILKYNSKLIIEYNDSNNLVQSCKPNKNPNNGIFTVQEENIIIDSYGIISLPTNNDIGEYSLTVNYSINSVTTSIEYFYEIIPQKIKVNFNVYDKYYNGLSNVKIKHNYNFPLLYETEYDSVDVGNRLLYIKNISIDNIDIQNKYKIEDVIVKTNIIQLELDINFIGIDKIYNGSNNATVEYTINNLCNNDKVFIIDYIALFETVTVGKQKIIIKNINLGGKDSKNYKAKHIYETFANINKAELLLSFSCEDKIYNNNKKTILKFLECTGMLKKDHLSIDFVDAEYSDINVGDQIPINIKTIRLKGKDAYNYYGVSKSDIYGNIFPKEVTPILICNDKVFDNTKTAIITFEKIEDYNIISYDAEYIDENVGNKKQIIIKNIIIDNKNYFIKDKTILGNILPKQINFHFEGTDKIYDGKNNVDGIINLDISNIVIEYDALFKNINCGSNRDIVLINCKINSNKNYCIGTCTTNKSTILPRKINVEFLGFNKTYDSTTDAYVKLKSVNNLCGNDKIKIKNYKSYFEDKSIGINKKIIISNIELENNFNNNYYVEESYTYANIDSKELHIILLANDKTYDTTTNADITIQSIKGILFNDNIYIMNYIAAFEDPNFGIGKNVFVKDFIFGGTDSKNYHFNKIIKTKANINKLLLPINFTNQKKIYDGKTVLTDISYNIADLDIKIKSYNANFLNANVGKNKVININKITLEGQTANNYYVEDYKIFGDIDYTKLNIKWICEDKFYDGSNIANVKYITNNNLKIEFKAFYTDENVKIEILNKYIDNYFLDDEYIITGNILPMPIKLNIINKDKIFDDICDYDVLFDTSFNIISYNAYFEDKNVGINKKIIIKDIIIDSQNYICKDIIVYGNIVPQKIIANINIENKIYNKNDKAKILNYTFEKKNIRIISYDATFEDCNSGLQNVFIKNIILSNKNYCCDDQQVKASIIPINLTKINFVIEDKIYDGTTNAKIIKYTIIDKIEILSYSANFTDEIVGNNKIVNISNITFSNPNYISSSFSVIGIIKPKVLTINFSNKDKITVDSIDGIINNDLIYVESFNSKHIKSVDGKPAILVSNIIINGTNISNYTVNNQII